MSYIIVIKAEKERFMYTKYTDFQIYSPLQTEAITHTKGRAEILTRINNIHNVPITVEIVLSIVRTLECEAVIYCNLKSLNFLYDSCSMIVVH